jgi:hypothetical protein
MPAQATRNAGKIRINQFALNTIQFCGDMQAAEAQLGRNFRGVALG